METVELSIGGMHCEGCAGRVSAALQAMPGVAEESVKVGSARVTFDPKKTSVAAIVAGVNSLGFSAKKSGSWFKRLAGK